MPPLQIHVGLGEVLVAENAIFATRMAAAGGACELHEYDQMWHVFAMYYEGCEHPKVAELLFVTNRYILLNTVTNRYIPLHTKGGGAPLRLLRAQPHGHVPRRPRC